MSVETRMEEGQNLHLEYGGNGKKHQCVREGVLSCSFIFGQVTEEDDHHSLCIPPAVFGKELLGL